MIGECLAGCDLGTGVRRAKPELETSKEDKAQQGWFLDTHLQQKEGLRRLSAQSPLWHEAEVLKEVFRLMYLMVSASMFCPQASKASKPPSRVCGSKGVSIIERKSKGSLSQPVFLQVDGMSLRLPEELEM